MDEQARLRAALKRWGTTNAQRDALVLAAIAAGVSRQDIVRLTGLGRTTIYEIEKKGAADGE